MAANNNTENTVKRGRGRPKGSGKSGKKKVKSEKALNYTGKKEYAAQYSLEKSAFGRDIGDIPKVKNASRKKKCEKSFEQFCLTYFPNLFEFQFSDTHLKAIELYEEAINDGKLFCVAMPRGSGKTVLSVCALLWATLYAKCGFAVIIAVNSDRAKEMLDKVRTQLETNELLIGDFPEVCYPIKKLERINNRQKGQTYKGKPTLMTFGRDKIVFPTIPKKKTSGIVVTCCGMRGGDLRGQSHGKEDGTVTRPDLVLIDDPQDAISAASPSQIMQKEQLLAADVLGMAGPGKKISGLLGCTVIRKNDLADRILSDDHPEYQSIRCPMIIKWPTNMKLWEEYYEIKREDLLLGGKGNPHIEFYLKNRREMDEGAEVYWEARKTEDDISALQHAMDLFFRDKRAFASEFQNDPEEDAHEHQMISVDDILGKTSGYARHYVPPEYETLTAFIDIQGDVLFYTVIASRNDFTSSVIDYDTWPKAANSKSYFTLDNIPKPLSERYGDVVEVRVLNGLMDCIEYLATKDYNGHDQNHRISRIGVDCNWGETSAIAYQAISKSPHNNIVFPCHGTFYGARTKSMSEQKRKRGDKIGLHWKIPKETGNRSRRHFVFDTNFWKSFAMSRLATPTGADGCLNFYGKFDKHQMLCDHLTSEHGVLVSAGDRTVTEFKLLPNRRNDWLDCVVGSLALLSHEQCDLGTFATQKPKKERKKVLTFAEAKAQRKVLNK